MRHGPKEQIIDTPAFAVPTDWSGIRRVLIEYCPDSASALGHQQEFNSDCLHVRCSRAQGLAKSKVILSLVALVRSIPRDVAIVLWCTMPSSSGTFSNGSGQGTSGTSSSSPAARCSRWHRLFGRFLAVAQAVVEKGGHLVLQWPATASSWRERGVKELLGKDSLRWVMSRVPHLRAREHGGAQLRRHRLQGLRIATTLPGLADALSALHPGDQHGGSADRGPGHFSRAGRTPHAWAQAAHTYLHNVNSRPDPQYTATLIAQAISPARSSTTFSSSSSRAKAVFMHGAVATTSVVAQTRG